MEADRCSGSREIPCDWNVGPTEVRQLGRRAANSFSPVKQPQRSGRLPAPIPLRKNCRELAATGLRCDLGVPGDPGKLLLAGFPFVAGEDARCDVDQAGDEAEDGGGGPGAAVARTVIADV